LVEQKALMMAALMVLTTAASTAESLVLRKVVMTVERKEFEMVYQMAELKVVKWVEWRADVLVEN